MVSVIGRQATDKQACARNPHKERPQLSPREKTAKVNIIGNRKQKIHDIRAIDIPTGFIIQSIENGMRQNEAEVSDHCNIDELVFWKAKAPLLEKKKVGN